LYLSFILDTELKSAACTKTGCMVALEIQRGKVGMSTQRHMEHGGTTACCLRLVEQFSIPSSREGFIGDAWFGSVKAVAQASAMGFLSVLQVKNNKALYPKEYIEGVMKDMPGGVHIVLTATHPNGTPLVAVGYRYSKKTTLFFIFHRDAGSTRPGAPYEMKYGDDYGNVCIRLIDRPDVISRFFKDSNIIDMHNQVRQDELGLEKSWVSTDGYFRNATTLIGINVVDCWKLAQYHKVVRQDEMSIVRFAGVLGKQLVEMAKTLTVAARAGQDLDDPSITLSRSVVITTSSQEQDNTSSLSSIEPRVQRIVIDTTGTNHLMLQRPITKSQRSGKRYCKTRDCHKCRNLTAFYCLTCGFSFCSPTKNINRDCFAEHVLGICRASGRLSVGLRAEEEGV
jgi:hypothetical protein